MGVHPGVSGQFSLLEFADATDGSVVRLEKRSDVRRYSDMYAHLQAQVLSPDMTGNFIEEALKVYAGKEFRPDARTLSLQRVDRVLGADHSQAPLSPWTARPGAQPPNGGPGGSLCA